MYKGKKQFFTDPKKKRFIHSKKNVRIGRPLMLLRNMENTKSAIFQPVVCTENKRFLESSYSSSERPGEK